MSYVETPSVHYGNEHRIEESELDRYPRVADKSVRDYSTREVGLQGEIIAARKCELLDYEILERNWRCPWGEADIIALDGDTIVMMEVKTRVDLGDRYGVMPELAVDEEKRARYRLISLAYLSERPGFYCVRYDVVAVTLVANDRAKLRHLINAYIWED